MNDIAELKAHEENLTETVSDFSNAVTAAESAVEPFKKMPSGIDITAAVQVAVSNENAALVSRLYFLKDQTSARTWSSMEFQTTYQKHGFSQKHRSITFFPNASM